MRDVQTELRSSDSANKVVGVALDENLTFEEQGLTAGPFIALGVVMILLLVSILLRSYWAGTVVAIGLAISIIQFQAVMTLMDMRGGLLLGIVVPISAISFGVDFFVHSTGRLREELADDTPPSMAYPRGLTAVFGAILLALVSSGVAFLANTTAGIQAITEFGIGAAVALTFSFIYLGILAPRMLLALETGLLPRRTTRPTSIARWIGLLAMTLFAGLAVATTVVLPVAGAVMAALFVALALLLPQRVARRRARQNPDAKRAALGQAGHSIAWVGVLVEKLARRRYITLGVTATLSAVALSIALNVGSGADISDFLSPNTDFVTGIQKIGDDFPSGSGDPGVIVVEGDLSDPATLQALDAVYARLSESLPGDAIVRDADGSVARGDDAVTLVRTTMATPSALQTVESMSGIDLTDTDRDGLADTPEQILAIYTVARNGGLPADDGTILYTPGDVEEFLFLGDGIQSTTLVVMVPVPEQDASGVFRVHDVLGDEAAVLASNEEITGAEVAGIGITEQRGFQSFTDAMALSLPLALLLCLLVAAGFMRSVRYGFASVLPILLVVTWLYAFMEIAGYRINAVTATLAAIAVGVGIDYATHFTMRFREEMEGGVERLTAMQRAGAATGGALTISALSSILGFLALSLAPMPIFAVYGLLTAVMITFSLAMSLLVLPSILMLVTPGRDRRRDTEKQDSKNLNALGMPERLRV
ncbi:MAG: MMPL family transporter [Acidimicrobiales bacterium]